MTEPHFLRFDRTPASEASWRSSDGKWSQPSYDWLRWEWKRNFNWQRSGTRERFWCRLLFLSLLWPFVWLCNCELFKCSLSIIKGVMLSLPNIEWACVNICFEMAHERGNSSKRSSVTLPVEKASQIVLNWKECPKRTTCTSRVHHCCSSSGGDGNNGKEWIKIRSRRSIDVRACIRANANEYIRT